MPELIDASNIVTTIADTDLITVTVGGVVKRITKANLLATSAGPLHLSNFNATLDSLISAYTPDTGSAWTNPNGGDWKVVEFSSGSAEKGVTQQGTATSNYWVAVTTLPAQYYTYKLSFNIDTSSGVVAQMMLRFTDMNNYVVFAANSGVYNVVGGTATIIGSGSLPTISDSNLHELKAVVSTSGSDTVVTIFYDNTQVWQATLPTAQSGTKAGFASASGAAGSIGVYKVEITA